jgi:hypothetical protein
LFKNKIINKLFFNICLIAWYMNLIDKKGQFKMNIKKISMCLALLLCLDNAMTETQATETSNQKTATSKQATAPTNKAAAKKAETVKKAVKKAGQKAGQKNKKVGQKAGQKNKKVGQKAGQKAGQKKITKFPAQIITPEGAAVAVQQGGSEAVKATMTPEGAAVAVQQGGMSPQAVAVAQPAEERQAELASGEANSKTLKERLHDPMHKKITQTLLKVYEEEKSEHEKTKKEVMSLRAEKEQQAKANPRIKNQDIPKAPDLEKAREYFLARQNNLSIPKEKKEAFVTKLRANNNGPMVTEEGLKEGLKNLRPAGKIEKMETDNERAIREIQSVKLRPAPAKEKTDVAEIVQGGTIIAPGGTNAVTDIVEAVDTAKVAEDAARKAAALEESRKNEDNAHKAALNQEAAEKAAAEKAEAEKAAQQAKAAAEKAEAEKAAQQAKAAAEKAEAEKAAQQAKAAAEKEQQAKAAAEKEQQAKAAAEKALEESRKNEDNAHKAAADQEQADKAAAEAAFHM